MTSIPAPGPHGGDGARVARALGIPVEEVLDLSMSLNPLAPDPRPLLQAHLSSVRRYPDPAPATVALARRLGAEPDRVVLTNGGAEAIDLVGRLLGGAVEEPEFALYPRGGGPRWRSNPRSPSGQLAAPGEEAAVWDEAFWPLATGTWTRGDAGRGAWVVGSLTKLLACPGLRMGYVLAPDPAGASAVRALQPAWSVSTLACEALPELLDLVDLPAWAAGAAHLREQLRLVLVAAGFDPRPSDACWLLVEAPGLRERLARQGIVVRDCTSFGMPGVVRIGVPDGSGLLRLMEALQ